MADSNTPFRPPLSSEIYERYSAQFSHTNKQNHQELIGWSLLGIAVLALAGVMALLVAMSRIPGIEQFPFWPIDFFQKGLVIHVIFSFIVWFFAIFGALLCIGSANSSNSKLGLIILSLVVAASIILAIPAFTGSSSASLNNYVPTIMNPIFYGGLAVLVIALAAQAIRLLVNSLFKREPSNLFKFMITLAAILFCIALICLVIAGNHLLDETLSEAFNENLFWGFGHILQFSNVALLVAAWIYLADSCSIHLTPIIIKISGGILLIGALSAPLFYVIYEPFSATQQLAFTNLQYVFAPATGIIVASFLVAIIGQGGRYQWRNPAFLTLILSIFVFSIGGFLGLFVDGADTRTPAHYHGVIAGINLAFMGLYYTLFLPLLNRAITISKIIYLQVGLFAGGQTLASIGLFLAGGYGVPRKVAGADQGLELFGAYAGMAMNGIGAVIAIIGGILFIWSMARALLNKPSAS